MVTLRISNINHAQDALKQIANRALARLAINHPAEDGPPFFSDLHQKVYVWLDSESTVAMPGNIQGRRAWLMVYYIAIGNSLPGAAVRHCQEFGETLKTQLWNDRSTLTPDIIDWDTLYQAPGPMVDQNQVEQNIYQAVTTFTTYYNLEG